MEIGPVVGIRTVSLLTVQRAGESEPPVFEIDASARAGEENDSPGHRPADRGLEEDESGAPEDGEAGDETGPEVSEGEAKEVAGISFFA